MRRRRAHRVRAVARRARGATPVASRRRKARKASLIARGVLAFRNGFDTREDILWGGLFYLLALAVYLALARAARPQAPAPRRDA